MLACATFSMSSCRKSQSKTVMLAILPSRMSLGHTVEERLGEGTLLIHRNDVAENNCLFHILLIFIVMTQGGQTPCDNAVYLSSSFCLQSYEENVIIPKLSGKKSQLPLTIEGIQQGIQQGIQNEKKETILRMKAKGFSLDDISESVGISKEEIATLLQ